MCKQETQLQTISHRSRLMPISPLQPAINAIHNWSHNTDMMLNTAKTKTMNISSSLSIKSDLGLNVNSDIIEEVSEFKLLGVIIDKHLSFSSHVDSIHSRARSRLNALLTLKRYGVEKSSLLRFYLANVRSVLSYAAPAWFSYLSDTNKNRLESIQRQCLRIIYPDIPYEDRLLSASIPSPCNYLSCICMTFVSNVASDPQQRLHKHLPKRHCEQQLPCH